MPDSPKRVPDLTAVVATVVSAAAHFGVIAWGASALPSLIAPRTSLAVAPTASANAAVHTPGPIEIDLPAMALGVAGQPGPPSHDQRVEPLRTGGSSLPRPDSQRRGRGGTDTASEPAVNLADRNDGLRLARDLTNHLDRDQVSRVRSAKTRSSRDDERITTNPMELTFVASGPGREQERRPEAETSPSRGLAYASPPTFAGTDRLGGAAVPEGTGQRVAPEGGDRLGADHASPGAGIADGQPGADHRNAAASELARPDVARGDPSVPSDAAGEPRDTVDSHQQVAAKAQSLVDSSAAGGVPGEGPGGAKGIGLPGSGGVDGPGSRSAPMGHGPGSYGASAVDPRMVAYKRRIKARLDPYWANAFPRWAIADLRQGRVAVAFEILANGRVQNVRVTRPSGIDEFDRNCVAAILRASPFEPIPMELGVRSIRWEISFDVSNPVVR